MPQTGRNLRWKALRGSTAGPAALDLSRVLVLWFLLGSFGFRDQLGGKHQQAVCCLLKACCVIFGV